MSITDIPPEILTIILSYITYDDLLYARLTCRIWYEIIDNHNTFATYFSHTVVPRVWTKYKEKVTRDEFVKNYRIYNDRILRENQFLEWNIVISNNYDNIMQQLIQTFTFPSDLDPTEFRDFLRYVRFSINSQENFISWVDSLIILYK